MKSYFIRFETWDKNAVTEAWSAVVPPECFPLSTSFSFDEATLGPLTVAGAELELEFSTLAAYNIQIRVAYGKNFWI